MSTVSPLPFETMEATTSSSDALKQQVAARLAQHRQRRAGQLPAQQSLEIETDQNLSSSPRKQRVAAAVAERFQKSVSYHDFLAAEAEAAVRQAEAVAEVARRNAEAIANAQQQLLEDIAQWSLTSEEPVAEVIVLDAPPLDAPPAVEIPKVVTSVSPMAGSVAATRQKPVLGPAPELRVSFPSLSTTRSTATYSTNALVPATVPTEPEEHGIFAPEILDPIEPTTPLPANLIEFPRQLVATRKARPRLAEGPLRDEADAAPERAQLRIFEVEADQVSIEPVVEAVLPEWSSIHLGAQSDFLSQEPSEAQVSFAIPLQTAPIHLRLMAASVDGCCIVAAFLLFVLGVGYTARALPTGMLAAGAAAGVLFALYLLYQALFFCFSDATPGMRFARIGFCTFADENPTKKAMRMRILAVLLAAIPGGLGFIWAMLDDDRLGWHDRISRMYPRAY